MADTFVLNGTQWWLCSGRLRQRISQAEKDNASYWYPKGGRPAPGTCLDDDGQHPKNFADADMDFWGVDVATLQGGGSGVVLPHTHNVTTTGTAA